MVMQARLFLIVLLMSGVVCISGCGTAKGIAAGIGSTAKGITEDAKGVWSGLEKADDWMKKNLW